MKGKVGGQWNKIFMEIYRSILHGFLPFSPVSLSELCSFWYGLKDLFTLHKSADKFVERTWIRTGGYGRFRGEWVNPLNPTIHVQILQTDVHTFPLRPRRENSIKDQSVSLR